MRPRLLASDLDGTLLRSDGSVSSRTAAAWARAGAEGIETVLVTARPPRWLHDLDHVVGPRGVAICGNGAFVYDVAARRVIEAHPFDPDALAAVVAELRRALPSIRLAAERASGAVLEPGFPDPHREADGPGVARAPGPALLAEPVGKLLAVAPGVPQDDLFATVVEVVGDRGTLHFSGAGGLAEINAPGVSKAVALERWAGEVGVARADVWAFGDMPNDLPMIRWAGVGWAMANAHEQVRAEADRVCGGNDEDGVATEVERVLG